MKAVLNDMIRVSETSFSAVIRVCQCDDLFDGRAVEIYATRSGHLVSENVLKEEDVKQRCGRLS